MSSRANPKQSLTTTLGIRWSLLAIFTVFILLAPSLSTSTHQVHAGTQFQTSNPAALVSDIRTNSSTNIDNGDLVMGGFYRINSLIYFEMNDGIHGSEPWRTDGTAQGTYMIKDIAPGNAGSYPSRFILMNSEIYFTADNGEFGNELWKTDGTDEGTVLVKDLSLGINSSYPLNLEVVGNKLFINKSGLWVSDGTTNGTMQLNNMSINSLISVGEYLFFTADDGLSGYELWKTDGTKAGTVQIKDIAPGSKSSVPDPLYNNFNSAIINSKLYFIADDGINGSELWISDGTNLGTHIVKDIFNGSKSSDINEVITYNNALYFTANDGINGKALWKSDGTLNGTIIFLNISQGFSSTDISNLTTSNNLLFFYTYTDSIYKIWRTDGNINRTFTIFTTNSFIYLAHLSPNSTRLFFTYLNGNNEELWTSQGDVNSTHVVQTNLSFPGGKGDPHFTDLNDIVIFVANDGISGDELWRSDGTASGTFMIKDVLIEKGSDIEHTTSVGNILFFTADDGIHGRELWRSEGTANSTALVKDIYSGTTGSMDMWSPQPVAMNGQLFFVANDETHGEELWKSDGTSSGTVLVKDINPGFSYSDISDMEVMNGILYFSATDSSNGAELWRSDGTSQGTWRVSDINPGSNGSYPQHIHTFNGRIYFKAHTSSFGSDPWYSDGTMAGTAILQDIKPNDIYLYPDQFTTFQDQLYFAVGGAIWKSDGTSAGTAILKLINTSKDPSNFTVAGDFLYFIGDDGVHGNELWKTDGTPSNTTIVKDIFIGSADTFPDYGGATLINANGVLCFVANDGVNGAELWKSDGSEAGTFVIKDILPGKNGSLPVNLASIGAGLLFSASDGANGYQVWQSNLTASGTKLVQLIAPQKDHITPSHFTIAGGRVFFSADDGIYGDELWSMSFGDIFPISGALITSSPYYLPNHDILFLANLRSANQPIVGLSNISLKINGQSLKMRDDGQSGDAQTNDGIYSYILRINSSEEISARLHIGSVDTGASTIISPIFSPNLLILTDWSSLYREFLDTGMDSSGVEDIDNNLTHDFYDLVTEIRDYAMTQKGVVLDLPYAITTSNGFPSNYSSANYSQGTQERRNQGFMIDRLIEKTISSKSSIQNVAIIGDDQVVPFYRVYDPTDVFSLYTTGIHNKDSIERGYIKQIGGDYGNVVLQDLSSAYLLSDLPYSISSYQEITDVTWNTPANLVDPRYGHTNPDLGIGRVFSESPNKLQLAIQNYRKPISLTYGESVFAFFSGVESNDASSDGLANQIQQQIETPLAKYFQIDSHHAFDHVWYPQDLIDTASKSHLFSLWGHATHLGFTIKDNISIHSSDLSRIQTNQPLLFIGFGCNMGLTVSDYPDTSGVATVYKDAFMSQLIQKGITAFAPNSHAYSGHNNHLSLHANIDALLLNLTTDQSQNTVGSIWKSVFPIHQATDPASSNNTNNQGVNLFHIASNYGITVYGLPTQPVKHTNPRPNAIRIAHSSEIGSYTIPSISSFGIPLTFTVDIPKFIMSPQSDGSTTVSIPYNSTYMTPPNGPLIPTVVRSFVIPENVRIIDVSLIQRTAQPYPQPIRLTTASIRTGNGDVITRSIVLPPIYPESLFHYDISKTENGSILTVSIRPLQYDTASQQLTLYNHLEFQINTINSFPTGTAKISSISINPNDTIKINQSGQYINTTISSSEQQLLYLVWRVRDRNGLAITSGRTPLTVGKGDTIVAFELDTTEWKPGEKDFTIYLERESEVLSTRNIPLQAQGIGFIELNSEAHFYQRWEDEAIWHVLAADENGNAVTNLASSIEITVDNQPLTADVKDSGDGTYDIRFLIGSINPGKHLLKISAVDQRGIQGSSLWMFSISPPSKILLPIITRP